MSQHWMRAESNHKMSSPLTNRQLKTCLSFANIKNNKVGYELETPRAHNIPTNENTAKKQKQNINMLLEFKEQNGSRAIIDAYKLQNNSLKETICVFKEQVAALQNTNYLLKQQCANVKQEAAKKDARLAKTLAELQQSKLKLSQFQGIAPKIEQLQLLQDTMIMENQQLKRKQSILKKLLGEILVSIGSSKDSLSLSIKSLVNQTCNQL